MKLSDRLLEALGTRPGETAASRTALIDYALMEKRSLPQLCQRYERRKEAPTKRLATLKDWSSKYEWQARLVDFDVIRAEEDIEETSQRKKQLRELDWQQGLWLRKDVFRRLKLIPKATHDKDELLNHSRLAKSLEIASNLQRLAVGEPTGIVDLQGAALDAFIENQLARVGHVDQATPGGSPGEEADPSASQEAA